MTAAPRTAWAALLSALGHGYLSPAEVCADDPRSRHPQLGAAWRAALRFTASLMLQGIDPRAVPPDWTQADAIRASAFLRQGFAVMGLYRPGERGTGNDMTVSVDPRTGIDLRELWIELERLETARWDGQRPHDRIRALQSYPPGTGWNQPWWDDHGRYTLLGAPKALPDWPAGSRLDWPEVLDAIWRCYGPLRDLHVTDLHGTATLILGIRLAQHWWMRVPREGRERPPTG